MAEEGTKFSCPVCNCRQMSPFFEIPAVPVNVCLQWPAEEQALKCPKADIRLAFCSECGFISNIAFDPAKLHYGQQYENSLYFSSVFREYTRELALRLINRYDIRNKSVIEIGCGKGEFLRLLCELGNNRATGFDPSYDDFGSVDEAKNITFIRDLYSDKYASYQADMICSRYVLEHIGNPQDFLRMIRDVIGKRETVVYFEVPDISLIFDAFSIWDIIYEHCSYFGLTSLRRIFVDSGFRVCDLYESYHNQFLGIEAVVSNDGEKPHTDDRVTSELERRREQVKIFSSNSAGKLRLWQKRLQQIGEKKLKAVVWGAGAKGVSFLNMLKVEDEIRYVVDINPRKRNKFIAGTGQRIVSPEFLKDYKPDIVIVPNEIYINEIRETVAKLGLEPEFVLT